MNKETSVKSGLKSKTVFVFKKANKPTEIKSDPTGTSIITIVPTTSRICD